MSEAVLKKQLERARREVSVLEKLIEDKTRSLFQTQENLRERSRFVANVLATIDSAVVVVGNDGKIRSANRAALALTGHDEGALVGQPFPVILPGAGPDPARLAALYELGHETVLRTRAGADIPVMFAAAPLLGESGSTEGIVCVAHDLREKKQLELELRHAQKLESVGQLAAGVAHEINTPVQFAGDSVRFLQEALADLGAVVLAYRGLRTAAVAHSAFAEHVQRIDAAELEADLEFLAVEIPAAIDRAIDGVQRVATIVGAMKAFAHPGAVEKAPGDLNEVIRTTLVISRNEYKYVADVETDLGEIPLVTCNLGDINQVLLNLIVNAAHAISAKVGNSADRGRIAISTRRENGDVVIEVADTGTGIPAAIHHRMFEPFFTTKEVGKGTGQGLAISRNIVVDKHGGDLRFTTEAGKGTAFFVRLPIDGAAGAGRT